MSKSYSYPCDPGGLGPLVANHVTSSPFANPTFSAYHAEAFPLSETLAAFRSLEVADLLARLPAARGGDVAADSDELLGLGLDHHDPPCLRGDLVPLSLSELSLPAGGQALLSEICADTFAMGQGGDFWGESLLQFPAPPLVDILRVGSFSDPALRSPSVMGKVLGKMVRTGLLCPVRVCRVNAARIGIFAVRKEQNSSRLIFDMRRINLLFRVPEGMSISSLEAVAAAEVPAAFAEPSSHGDSARTLHGFGEDISNMFYQIGLGSCPMDPHEPPHISEYLCTHGTVGMVRDAHSKGCSDEERRAVLEPLRGWPDEASLGCTVLPMGWSWSPCLAQSILEHACGMPEDGRLRHSKVSPLLLPYGALPLPSRAPGPSAPHYPEESDRGRARSEQQDEALFPHDSHSVPCNDTGPEVMASATTLHSEYLDDFNCILFADESAFRELQDNVRDRLNVRHLPRNQKKAQEGLPLEILGAALLCRNGRVHLVPKDSRVLTVQTLLAAAARAGEVRLSRLLRILGMTSWIFLMRRRCLSVFQEVYLVVDSLTADLERVVRVPMAARRELAMAALLMSWIHSDLSAPWGTNVVAVDAGPEGFGVTRMKASQTAVRACGQLGLRSKQRRVASFGSTQPDIDHLLAAPACDSHWFAGNGQWAVVIGKTWTKQTSVLHNNVLEGYALLSGLAEQCRCLPKSRVGATRILILTDSLVILGAVTRGRSSRGPINAICRRVLQYEIEFNVIVAVRYIPTWANPADGPSRGVKSPLPDPDTVLKALQKWDKCYPGESYPPALAAAGRRARDFKAKQRWHTRKTPGHDWKRGVRIGEASNPGPRKPGRPATKRGPARRARAQRLRDRGAGAWTYAQEVGVSGLRSMATPLLLLHSVNDSTIVSYTDALNKFTRYCAATNIVMDGSVPALDDAVLLYCNERCYFYDESSHCGHILLSALGWYEPRLVRESLPQSRRACLAWDRVSLKLEGEGFSEETYALLVEGAMERSRTDLARQRLWLEVATIIGISVDAYLRTQDWHELQLKDVFSAGPVIGLRLFERLTGQAGKTGSDQGVDLLKAYPTALFRELLTRRHREAADTDAFVFTVTRYQFDRALRSLVSSIFGPDADVDITPHSTRHAGASQAARRGTSMYDIRVRGRWHAEQSAQRYTSVWKLTRQNSLMPKATLARGRALWNEFYLPFA